MQRNLSITAFLIISTWANPLMALTEDEFNTVLDKVEAIYAPIMRAQGQNLVFDRYWGEERVDALAYKMSGKSHIAFYGGMARFPGMTLDIYAAIACHELGHHLGRLRDWRGISPEGEADYFAGLSCLKTVWSKEDNITIVKNLAVHPKFRDLCNRQYKDANQSAICQRIGVVAEQDEILSAKASPLGSKIKPPSLEEIDSSVVSKTYRGYPMPQCRLDTVLAGALCKISIEEPGCRPRCWFKD